MQFIDLAAQQQRIKQQIDQNIQAVLSHGKYIMGPEVAELEGKLAEYTGVKHAIGCASGTDALLLALMANGVGPGDAIFAPTFTFVATVEVASLLGATPVFVDIDPKTFNIDPDKLESAINAVNTNDPSIYPLPNNSKLKTQNSKLTAKGIIAVDLFGLPADYDRINQIATANGLAVIEDAAQSFGAEYNEKKACSLSSIATTSFFPAKPLGCYGDGGMCFTDDDEKSEAIRSFLLHGKGTHKYDNARIGINGRLDTLQAAILLAKFGIFKEEVDLRQQVARRYNSLFSPCPMLQAPCVPEGYKSAWAQYSILAKDEIHRSSLQAKLKAEEIPTAIYYPTPLHLQTAFKNLGYNEGDFSISEDYSKRIFSLPMHPYLKAEDQERIAQVIKEH